MQTAPRQRKSFGRRVLGETGKVLMGFLAAAVILGVAMYGPSPRVGPLPAPQSQDAGYAQVVGWTLQHIARQPDRSGDLAGTVEDFNGLFRLLARSNPGIAGRVGIEDGAMRLDVSMRVPRAEWLGWINVSAVIPPFSDGPELQSLRLGHLPLPPAQALRAAAWAVDRQLGAGAAEELLAAVPALSIDGDRLLWDLVFPDDDGRRFTRVGIAELYNRDMPSRTEVGEVVAHLQAEARERPLPGEGSFLPWLDVTLRHAADRAEAGIEPQRALLAGFLALNYLCGSETRYGHALLPPRAAGEAHFRADGPRCDRAGLHDRSDLRQHFVAAATVKLLSDRTMAVTAGETKELFDMLQTGYDFTDVAANNSGIRLAMLASELDADGLRALAERITGEDDVIIDLRGIPGVLEESAFRLRFGEVDSPQYKAMIAEIEARIDRLPIHRAAQDG